MRQDLAKLSIGEAFDEAFDLYKRNFGVFATITGIFYIPAQIIFSALWLGMQGDMLTNSGQPNPAEVEKVFGFLGVMFLALVVYYVVIAAVSGALTIAASERYLGRPITTRQAYGATFRALPRLLGAWTLIGIMIMVAIFGLSFVMAMATSATMMAIGAAGALDPTLAVVIGMVWAFGFIVLAVSIFVWLGNFATAAVLLEGAGAIGAITRNIDLVKGRVLKLTFGLIGLMLIVYGVQMAIAGCLQLGLDAFVFTWLHTPDLVQKIVEVALGGIISLFVHPLWMITLTILYYDQRVRQEGFDIALMLVGLDARRARLAEVGETAG